MSYSTVTVTPGVGAGIAVDVVGGADYQRIKVAWGAQGTVNEIDTPTPLPVQPVVGTTAVSSAAPLPVAMQTLSATQGYSWVKLDSAAGGNIDLIAAVASQTVRIYAGFFTIATPTTVQFADSNPTTLTGAMTFGVGGGMMFDPILGPNGFEPWFLTAVGKGFRIVMGAAVQISGAFAYKQSV